MGAKLTAGEQALFDAAKMMRKNAHVPYSRFHVGAAILADDGEIYAGCNVENAAYPLGSCAEASAISAMIAGGGRQIELIIIVGSGSEPVTPCGGCRQRIREFAGPDAMIVCFGVDGDKELRQTLEQLLPHSFGPEFLGDKS